MKPKIELGMPFEDYLAVEALSFTGVCRLLVSPLDFYMRCPWLCAPELLVDDDSTKAQLDGRAMHKRVVEGREAFEEAYAPAFEPDNDCLVKHDEIKDRLRALGQKVGGNKPELIQRLLEVQPTARIADVLEAEYREQHADKEFLPQSRINEIEHAAAMIEMHPELKKAFTGGQAEVSVFWNFQGVPMKTRIDYLKPRAVIEYKTFSNARRMPVDKAVMHALANEKYHIQAVIYQTALDALGHDERAWLWVFQQQGPIPLARGKMFPRGSMFDVGMAQFEHAVDLYKENLAHFGDAPWVDLSPISTIDDTEFPVWATD